MKTQTCKYCKFWSRWKNHEKIVPKNQCALNYSKNNVKFETDSCSFWKEGEFVYTPAQLDNAGLDPYYHGWPK